MVTIRVDVSNEVIEEIDRFAARHRVSHREAMRRVLSLVKVANAEARRGHRLGVIEERNGTTVVVAALLGV